MTATIVLAGGDPVTGPDTTSLPREAYVVAADSGLHHARDLGLAVDLVVGDLDSADPSAVARATAEGARLERHPADKGATDLELALDAALRRGADPTIVLGGAGFDRIDHFMANALLVASSRYAPLHVRWHVKGAVVIPVHDRCEIPGRPGDIVTLLAVGGPAEGVTTEGLRWALAGERLEPGSTRGVSNELTCERASVSISAGTLLVIGVGRVS